MNNNKTNKLKKDTTETDINKLQALAKEMEELIEMGTILKDDALFTQNKMNEISLKIHNIIHNKEVRKEMQKQMNENETIKYIKGLYNETILYLRRLEISIKEREKLDNKYNTLREKVNKYYNKEIIPALKPLSSTTLDIQGAIDHVKQMADEIELDIENGMIDNNNNKDENWWKGK